MGEGNAERELDRVADALCPAPVRAEVNSARGA